MPRMPATPANDAIADPSPLDPIPPMPTPPDEMPHSRPLGDPVDPLPPEPKDPPLVAQAARSGRTTPAIGREESPRLPHEHDESSDSQSSEPREVGRQAHEDVERGVVDTDRGPVMDDLYERSVRPEGEVTRDRGAPSKGGAKSRTR